MIINLPYVFASGNTIIASQHNSNNSTITNLLNGLIDTTNISPTAGILYSQLNLGGNIVNADISAAAAIVGSKLASLSSISSGAGVIPIANLPSTFVSGMILMWSGSVATIPTGWVLCNGSNGTPNLTDRFVIAAGNSYSPGATGNGSLPATSLTLTYNQKVTGSGGTGYVESSQTGGLNYGVTSSMYSISSFGSGSTNIAVYYALCFIMKS